MLPRRVKLQSDEKVSDISERLQDYLYLHGLKQKDLAELCKPYCEKYNVRIGNNDINQYIKGKASPNQDRLTILSKALKIPEVWLLGYDVPIKLPDNISGISTQQIPMIGDIACGSPIFAEQEYDSYVAVDSEVECDFCLRAKGLSMTGDHIYPGDIVFIKRQDMVENGEIAAVIIDDEATLKRVYYYKDKNLIIFRSSNPEYKDIVYNNSDLDLIYILGKAVAFTSKPIVR